MERELPELDLPAADWRRRRRLRAAQLDLVLATIQARERERQRLRLRSEGEAIIDAHPICTTVPSASASDPSEAPRGSTPRTR